MVMSDGLTDSRQTYCLMSDDCRKPSEIRLCTTAPNEAIGDTVTVGGFPFSCCVCWNMPLISFIYLEYPLEYAFLYVYKYRPSL
jgi:hypothetical protein